MKSVRQPFDPCVPPSVEKQWGLIILISVGEELKIVNKKRKTANINMKSIMNARELKTRILGHFVSQVVNVKLFANNTIKIDELRDPIQFKYEYLEFHEINTLSGLNGLSAGLI